MASGKQLAFTRGEVSPPFRYKSSSITYQEGLHRLRNGFPRRGGGVSNRPGFRHITDLVDTGIEPQGVRSNTKLFYVRKKIDSNTVDEGRKIENEVNFLYDATTSGTTLIGLKLNNDFSLDHYVASFPDHRTDKLFGMSWASFDDSRVFMTFGEKYGVTFKGSDTRSIIFPVVYSRMFERGRDVQPTRSPFVGTDGTRQVGPTPPAYAPENTEPWRIPALLIVIDDAGFNINRAIQGVYIITEELADGSELVVYGYEGSFVSYQGTRIAITLVPEFYYRAFSGTLGGLVPGSDQDSLRVASGVFGVTAPIVDLANQEGVGVLAIRQGGLFGVSRGNDNTRGTHWSIRLENVQFTNTGFPDNGPFKFNLYRGLSLGSSLSLVASVSGTYEDYLTQKRNIQFEDTGQVVTSRTFRQNLRLFGGERDNPEFNNTRLAFDAVNSTGHNNSSDATSGIHTLYRPRVPSTSNLTIAKENVPFQNISRIMRYQQRTFVSYTKPGPSIESTKKLTNVVGVSKINTDYDFSTGPIINPVNAFEFNVPINDPSPIVAMLPAERPLIFTESNVFMLLGTDAGIITPTEINPITVYTGGCSATVQPVLVDNQAFMLSNDHTSLVMIDFNKSGGRGVSIVETDAYAKHFLEKSITQIAVVKSFETIIWLLREDGTLLSMTMYEDGIFGFGLHELSDGYIENISSCRYPYLYQKHFRDTGGEKGWTVPDVEVLAATIIRDGRRSLEVMTGRDDRVPENMGFADGFKTFGMRLSRRSPSGYYTDLERENYRFDLIKEVDVKDDIDAVIEAFKNFVNAQTTVSQERVAAMEYGEFTGRPFDPTGRSFDPVDAQKRKSVSQTHPFFSKAHHEMINITKEVNGDEVDYIVSLNINAAIYSLQPPALSLVETAINPLSSTILNIYRQLRGGFTTHSQFNALSNSQKSLAHQMMGEGGLVYTDIKDINYYYKGKRYQLSPRTGYQSALSSYSIAGEGEVAPNVGPRYTPRYLTAVVVPTNDTFIKQQSPYRGRYVLTNTDTPIPDDALGVLDSTTLSADKKLEIATNWSPLSKIVTGLTHLAGKQVSVFADNEVVSSPLATDKRIDQTILTVDSEGTLELPRYFEWGLVGLPYSFEMESLQIEAQDHRTLIGGHIIINELGIALNNTREGVTVATIAEESTDPLEGKSFRIMDENIRCRPQDPERFIDFCSDTDSENNGTFSGIVVPQLQGVWSSGGRVRIANVDPTPVTVNAIYPKGISSGDE